VDADAMSAQTNIEWCDSTFNPWTGCAKVSPGCDHCYAEGWAKRSGTVQWGSGAQRRRTTDANWRQPLKWERGAAAFQAAHGRRQRVFCASLSDVFDNQVPAQWRFELLRLIDSTRNLDWLLLTKRIGNAAAMLDAAMRAHTVGREGWADNYLPNVWLGATVVNQAEADRDIPKLLATPAAVRFLSVEPMLGPIDLTRALPLRYEVGIGAQTMDSGRLPGIDWVICGGESGPGARPMHPDWARSLRDQCAAAGVLLPFLFKQWGEWLPVNQMDDEFMNRLYKPNRVAKLHEDQSALNDCYGRRCVVPQGVHQADGTLVDIASPMAFRVGLGSMQVFKVGKKAAGRLLDGRTHDKFPGVPR
jgi:protein gp37